MSYFTVALRRGQRYQLNISLFCFWLQLRAQSDLPLFGRATVIWEICFYLQQLNLLPLLEGPSS